MSVLHITSESFQEEVLNSSLPVLVDFFATWCGPCQMLSPVLDEIASQHSEFKVCKVDVDQAADLARKYRVMSVPTLLVVKGGEVVKRVSGTCTKDEILEMMA